MTTTPLPGEEPGAFLRRMMESHGLSSHAVAAMTSGRVSATTVRAAYAGKPVRAVHLAAIASVFPREVGVEVLRAYGLDALAVALEAGEVPLPPMPIDAASGPSVFRFEYQGARPLTAAEVEAVRAVIDAILRQS